MDKRTLVSRSDRKAFYGVADKESGQVTYHRMRGFTELSESKNPKEYTRQYVDEKFEQTDVVGYSPSLSFSFDKYTSDAVLEDISNIIDSEVVDAEAHRQIIQVDFSTEVDGGYAAKKRVFSIVADAVGNGLDALSYSGTLRPVGGTISGVATINTPENGTPETVETITFTES